jgi:hypothetical protein
MAWRCSRLRLQANRPQPQLANPASWPALRSDTTRMIVLGIRARLPEASWEPFLAGEADEHQRRDYAAPIQEQQN